MPIALVDYGAGNLTSVRKAFHHLGADIFTPHSSADLGRAAAVVVPGVGHFSATRSLTADWHAAIRDSLGAGRPLLGICVGMQWLFEGSVEAPECPGLGAIKGRCQRLSGGVDRLKVPHVGWNTLQFPRATTLFAGVDREASVYFTHSFAGPVSAETAAIAEYGDTGLAILRNFLRLVASREPALK
jgi:imidazole glycerol-phosphate synthase subunit HisH